MADIKTKLLNLTRQLFPTGRAFNFPREGVVEKFNQGLIKSENEAYLFARGILDSLLPDNANFTADDASIWELRLAMPLNTSATLADRKLAIERKLAHPGDILARQHYLYIQGQLQRAGFGVYCHENIGGAAPPAGALLPNTIQFGNINYGQAQYSQQLYNIVANYVDEYQDRYFTINDFKGAFFIGDALFPGKANVSIDRKDEFRELILRLKPAQTPAILLINYV